MRHKDSFLKMVLGTGVEPVQPQWPKEFKSFVSTIPPPERPNLYVALYGRN